MFLCCINIVLVSPMFCEPHQHMPNYVDVDQIEVGVDAIL
jgi:hypothetical protein